MPLTIKKHIINHINYRDVFNAPVKISELMTWLGVERNEHKTLMFDRAVNELIDEKIIVKENGYLAVFGKQESIQYQKEKRILSGHLIDKGNSVLKIISKLPFIKYIGISGSVAANNPTLDQSEHLDLDLFVISTKNSLWIVFLFERLVTNFIRLIKGDHFYCFNFVTEESFLEISNKNFFTATEIINLKTVMDKGIYNVFIESNTWYSAYYSNESVKKNDNPDNLSKGLLTLLTPINYLFYMLFCIGRGIKQMDLKVALEFTKKYDPTHKCNLRRISNPNGGYQEAIKKRFTELYQKNFERYNDSNMIDHLFPKEGSYQIPEGEIDNFEFGQLFSKYSLKEDEKSTV